MKINKNYLNDNIRRHVLTRVSVKTTPQMYLGNFITQVCIKHTYIWLAASLLLLTSFGLTVKLMIPVCKLVEFSV